MQFTIGLPTDHVAQPAEFVTGEAVMDCARVRKMIEGEAWLMPKSHWHYEMHFGNGALLEKVLGEIGIDAVELRDRNNGAAIEFSIDENDSLKRAIRALVGGLVQSDFLVAFPQAALECLNSRVEPVLGGQGGAVVRHRRLTILCRRL